MDVSPSDANSAARFAAKRSELEVLAREGEHERGAAAAIELVGLVSELRELGEGGLAAAEQALEIITELARVDGPRYLPALAGATEELGRCCQQAHQYDRAAAAFAQAVDAVKIIVASVPSAQPGLIELMSSHALALALAGELEQAYAVAGEFVALAREHLPHMLPLLTGGLVFMADLAEDLERATDGLAHLAEGLRVLAAAADTGLPGAESAAERLAVRLRATAEGLGSQLPDDLAALVDRLAPEPGDESSNAS
jgi:hypothetical protein